MAKRSADEFISPSKRQMVKSPSTIADLMNIKTTALARVVWGDAEFNTWQTLNSRINTKGQVILPSARTIFELSGPGTQCANTIGPLENSTFDRAKNKWTGTPCYVCGGVIVYLPADKVAARGIAGDDPAKLIGLKGQCEHVLSIAQAVLLYFLYNNDDKPLLRQPANLEFFKQEYRWAHNICNQEKGDTGLIKFENERFQVNDMNVANLLTKIGDSNRTSAAILRSMLKIDNLDRKAAWKQKRMVEIAKDLEEMVDYLNSKNGNMMMLTAAVNVIERVHGDFKDSRPRVALENEGKFEEEDSKQVDAPAAANQVLNQLGAPPDAPPINDIETAADILRSMKDAPMQVTRTGRLSSPRPKGSARKTRRRRCLPKLV